jgi:hypothetical protein
MSLLFITLMEQLPKVPTSPKAVLTLSLLSTGNPVHEKDIESTVNGNRCSAYIQELRLLGWKIKTIRAPKGETGSRYQMTDNQQSEWVSTHVDVTNALESLPAPLPELPSSDVAVMPRYSIHSNKIASQLNLFSVAQTRRDSRFDVVELMEGSLSMLNKTQMELLSGGTTLKESRLQAQLAKAVVEVHKAIQMFNEIDD